MIVESDKPSPLAAEALRIGLAVRAEVLDGHVELEARRTLNVDSIREMAGRLDAEVRSVEVKPKSISELYAEALA